MRDLLENDSGFFIVAFASVFVSFIIIMMALGK